MTNEEIIERAREAYEVTREAGMPADRPLTALENYAGWANEKLDLRGAQIDVWLDTWQECRRFEAQGGKP
jgi:hypothetical protein